MRSIVASKGDGDADEAVIVRAVLRLARQLRRSASSAKLTGGSLQLLVALYREGPMSAAALARAEGLQPQSLSRLLARLEKDGLIERTVDAADRRRQVIMITKLGLSALSWAMTQRRHWLSEAMSAQLDEGERATLVRAAELMLRLSSSEP